MYNTCCNLTLLNCTFIANSAWRSGGIPDWGSSTALTDSALTAITLENHVGGMYDILSSSIPGGWPFEPPTSRVSGGAIHNNDSVASIRNCTFAGNSARSGNALACVSSLPPVGVSSVRVNNSILWDGGNKVWRKGNSTVTVTYSDIEGSWPGNGNIDVAPQFVDPGYWADKNDPNIIIEPNDPDAIWIEGNYHLLGGSPCIDAGDPNYVAEPNETDLDGNPRVISGRIDMGAYEFFNTSPVADAGPDREAYAWIDGIAEVTLDGTGSSDDDGHPLTYLWRWTVDGSSFTATEAISVIELPVGEQTIELIVNDGIDDSEPDQVVITVVPPMESQLWVFPRVINQHSRQPKILAWVRLPEGVTKDQVDSDQPLTLYPAGSEAIRQYIFQYRRRGVQQTNILAFFDKAELMDAVPDNGRVELQVVGQLQTGQYFYGTDTVWIIGWRWKPWHRRR